jgi:hypothetical protein
VQPAPHSRQSGTRAALLWCVRLLRRRADVARLVQQDDIPFSVGKAQPRVASGFTACEQHGYDAAVDIHNRDSSFSVDSRAAGSGRRVEQNRLRVVDRYGEVRAVFFGAQPHIQVVAVRKQFCDNARNAALGVDLVDEALEGRSACLDGEAHAVDDDRRGGLDNRRGAA